MGGRSTFSGSENHQSGNSNAGGGNGGSSSTGTCPEKISTTITGPDENISAGTWLDVALDQSDDVKRVVLRDPASEEIVGSIAGLPNLAVLMKCIEEGVDYIAHVDKVSGGKIEITVLRDDL